MCSDTVLSIRHANIHTFHVLNDESYCPLTNEQVFSRITKRLMQHFNGYGNEWTVNYTQLLLQSVIDSALVPLYDADICNCGYIKDNKLRTVCWRASLCEDGRIQVLFMTESEFDQLNEKEIWSFK